MKSRTPFFLAMAITLGCAGCGQKPQPVPPKTTPNQSALPSSLPSLEAQVPPPPGLTSVGQTTQAGGSAAAPAAPASTGIDLATAARPVDSSGRELSDLEWLNQIVQGYLMTASMPDAALPAGRFRSLDEEMEARAAAYKKKQQYAAVRDLSDLVKVGLIKAIPAAPAGKKYVFDQKSGKVLMVNQ